MQFILVLIRLKIVSLSLEKQMELQEESDTFKNTKSEASEI